MSLSNLLSHWKSEPSIIENIAEWRILQGQNARLTPFPAYMHPDLASALQMKGIDQLYQHQLRVFDLAKSGANVVIATGTASGKTLAYNLPVIDRLLRDPNATAIYLFPTKALARDQLDNLYQLVEALRDHQTTSNLFSPAVYDGDTLADKRATIRNNSRLVLSNPDMLHAGLLPYHTLWADFFSNLSFIVIDEMHIYRGVFGSHVANVIRRLKRIVYFYQSKTQFILTSATIANPQEHGERLIEEPIRLISEDAAEHGRKHFLIYNPPIVDPQLGLRRSVISEAHRLAEDLLAYRVQTILFARTRRTVELLLAYLRQTQLVHQSAPSQMDSVPRTEIRGYRSGYLPSQRRNIEQGLRNGAVRAVVATNALELGIDIGALSASIMVGYPGTISSTWQQAGRAGRGTAESLAILLTSANPLDQYLAHHSDYIFEKPPEQALINPDNLLILIGHIRCALSELPFLEGDSFGAFSSEGTQELLNYLMDTGQTHRSGKRYYWTVDTAPSQDISLRTASPAKVVLQTHHNGTPRVIGEVDYESALWMVHPQAIYLHESQVYVVDELDLENKIAMLHPAELDFYTEDVSETTVNLVELVHQKPIQGAIASYGDLQVITQVVGFRRIKWITNEHLEFCPLDLPSTELSTNGFWLSLDNETVELLKEQRLWSNSPNEYGLNWKTLKEQVRLRDGFSCQVCGVRETGRAHDVHHKIPFRSYLSALEANQLDNLITLCAKCHQKVELNIRMRSGLAGLSYLLENLAPLFLMCDPRDLRVHIDQQSSLAEQKPTVVLFDRVPGGIGLCERLYEICTDLLYRARELVVACDCEDGCPACVGPAGENGIGGKQETLAILDILDRAGNL